MRHCLFDGYLKSDLLEALYQAACAAIGMQAVIVVAAKLLIDCAVLDDVPSNDQHRMRDASAAFLRPPFTDIRRNSAVR